VPAKSIITRSTRISGQVPLWDDVGIMALSPPSVGASPLADGRRCRGPLVAVVVTFNRLALLKVCLPAVVGQQRRPDVVLVVDNASTDGTAAWVAAVYPQCRLLRLSVNTGGAGGFAVGLQRAVEKLGADCVWLLDDDTVPSPSALMELVQVRQQLDRPPPLVASRVVWTDGGVHPMNTPRHVPWLGSPPLVPGLRLLRSASFVSVLIDGDAARSTAPPVADFFLWNDDFEYTTRLTRTSRGVLCERSVVTHHTATGGGSDVDPGSRFYYEVRNKLWVFTRSTGLAWWERPLYAVATARRWARTFRSSSDRRVLLRAGLHGMRDGLRAGPRANDVVLRDVEVLA